MSLASPISDQLRILSESYYLVATISYMRGVIAILRS